MKEQMPTCLVTVKIVQEDSVSVSTGNETYLNTDHRVHFQAASSGLQPS